jgi:hypothetical protein
MDSTPDKAKVKEILKLSYKTMVADQGLKKTKSAIASDIANIVEEVLRGC